MRVGSPDQALRVERAWTRRAEFRVTVSGVAAAGTAGPPGANASGSLGFEGGLWQSVERVRH